MLHTAPLAGDLPKGAFRTRSGQECSSLKELSLIVGSHLRLFIPTPLFYRAALLADLHA